MIEELVEQNKESNASRCVAAMQCLAKEIVGILDGNVGAEFEQVQHNDVVEKIDKSCLSDIPEDLQIGSMEFFYNSSFWHAIKREDLYFKSCDEQLLKHLITTNPEFENKLIEFTNQFDSGNPLIGSFNLVPIKNYSNLQVSNEKLHNKLKQATLCLFKVKIVVSKRTTELLYGLDRVKQRIDHLYDVAGNESLLFTGVTIVSNTELVTLKMCHMTEHNIKLNDEATNIMYLFNSEYDKDEYTKAKTLREVLSICNFSNNEQSHDLNKPKIDLTCSCEHCMSPNMLYKYKLGLFIDNQLLCSCLIECPNNLMAPHSVQLLNDLMGVIDCCNMVDTQILNELKHKFQDEWGNW